MNPSMFGNAQNDIGSILGGLFGNSGAPFGDAMNQYQQWANKAQGAEQPYWNAGNAAIPQYQAWLGSMQDPTAFVNKMMGQYQQSPYAQYMQQQSIRGAQNAASASGLGGSTPLTQQIQQNASNISNQDMQNWMNNVFGINTQYGAGLGGLMNQGAGSANALSNMYANMGQAMGEAAYGQAAGQQQDTNSLISGIAGLFL